MSIPDENIVAEIRMPDNAGNTCLTFILDRGGRVRCWPDFGDPVPIDLIELDAVVVALQTLRRVLCPPRLEGGETQQDGKTFEDIVHGR